ncbi:MAG: serine/threonine-protein kinase, partial [Ktedonobacteraceae bacterium]
MAQRSSRLIAGIYQVGQIITSGPLLTTYTAYNRNTSDVVGLLVLTLPPSCDPTIAQQLLAPLARRRMLQSQHVIRVHNWGICEGGAYIATDPPRGITLSQLEDSENIDLARALDLAIQMTRGVATLQAQSIIDTDLRPHMLTVDTIGLNDRVQLDDVGLRHIVRQLGYVQGLNMHDIGYLDPRYMAPESIYQGIISAASDVYQLGILLFELITGRPPFVGRTSAETGIMQSQSPVPRMIQFKHDTPPEVQSIVDRALAKEPLQRYPHAVAMLAELECVPRSHNLSKTSNRQAIPMQSTISPSDLPAHTKSHGLTTEMARLSLNTTFDPDETIIDETQTIKRLLDSTTLVPVDAPVFAYLDFEQTDAETQRLAITGAYVIVGRLDPKRGITPEID